MINSDLSNRSRRIFGLIGAGLFAGAAFTAYLGVQDRHPGSIYLDASFGRAGEGLDDKSAVKLRGINVGTVSSIKLDSQQRVRVRIRLDKGVKAPQSTTAAIQPLSVFGPKFVDLIPGSGETTGPYLADGGTIGVTRDPEELTDITLPANRLLDAVDPQDIATILHTFSEGLNGRGKALAGTIDDTGRLLDMSSANLENLRSLIGDGTRLARVAAAHGDQVAAVVRNVNALADPIAGDPTQISALLDGGFQTAQMLNAILLADPRAVGQILDRLSPTADLLYENRRRIAPLIAAVGADFDYLAGIIRVPGPENSLLTRTTSQLPLDQLLCKSFLDLCAPLQPALPLPVKGKR